MTLKTKIRNFLKKEVDQFRYGYELDLGALCNYFDIEVANAEFKDNTISGSIVKTKEGKWKIYVNKDDHYNRKIFTIAHELAHYISYLHKSHSYKELKETGEHADHVLVKNRNHIYNEEENEANEIAAEMLMPDWAVLELVKEGATPEDMAEKFNVSGSAMSYRLNELGYTLMEQKTFD